MTTYIPAKYRTTNWPTYNAALKSRGSLMLWIDKEISWHGVAAGKRGRIMTFSDAAIQFCLTIKGLITDNRMGDAPMLPELLKQIPSTEPLLSVRGDGAYDTKACYEAMSSRQAAAIIPVRKNAKRWKENTAGSKARNETLAATQYLGRTLWKKWSGYHQRSLVETKMRCFKLLGERVMARDFDRQVTELQVRVAILNRFTHLGTPSTQRVF